MDVNGKQYKNFLERSEKYEKHHNEAVKKQHSKGKLSAHERIELLFDPNTFEEVDAFSVTSPSGSEFGKITNAYGVIIGHGMISGRLAFVYAQDFSVMGGSLGSVHATKIAKIQDMALKMGAPIIPLNKKHYQSSRTAKAAEILEEMNGKKRFWRK